MSPAAASDPDLSARRLRAALSLLQRRLRASVRPGGPSVAKLSVLGHLYRQGALTPTALAASEGVRLQSLTRLLAELEAEEWVRRDPHPQDGRQSLLALTPVGRRRLQAHMQAREVALADAIGATLDATQRAQLNDACDLLETIAAAMDARPIP